NLLAERAHRQTNGQRSGGRSTKDAVIDGNASGAFVEGRHKRGSRRESLPAAEWPSLRIAQQIRPQPQSLLNRRLLPPFTNLRMITAQQNLRRFPAAKLRRTRPLRAIE